MTRARAWARGARPRTLTAAAAPVLVGSGLAANDGVFSALPALACLAAAALIQVGTNLYNDWSDHARGADTEERAGETRVTQAGLLEPREVRRGALIAYGAATAVGAYLVAVGGWPILAIGVAAVGCGIAYTGGPWPYGYHGLGDLFVFLFFGLIAVAGTYYVQAGSWSAGSLWAGSGVGALSTAVLAVNNLRDIPTDRRAGKRTLAVILGEGSTRVEYALLLALAAAVPAAGVGLFGWPPAALLALGAFLLAARPAATVLRSDLRDRAALDPALAGTARALGAYGLLLAVGLGA